MYNEVILINPNNLSDEKKETSFHIPKLKTSSFGRRNIRGNGGWTGDDAFLMVLTFLKLEDSVRAQLAQRCHRFRLVGIWDAPS